MSLAELWPLAGLRVLTPVVELRFPSEEDLVAVATLAMAGIHNPASTPFSHPWTDAPAADIGPGLLQYHWRQRANWAPAGWALPFAVVRDGVVVGTQALRAEHFGIQREVATVSWLGITHQGVGTGTEMRAAVLHLAFAGLGALDAVSGAFTDNAASLTVSRKLGYADDGIERLSRRGQVATMQRLRLAREVWLGQRRDDITIEGLDECRAWFGLG